jgi:molybdenum cofactor cytidylyltransferase
MVSAILLAAGESRRMGRPKLLLAFGDSTILGKTIDNLLRSRVEEVIVVLGAEADAMKQVIADRPVKVVVNPDYHEGMSTSLRAGLKQVDTKAQRVMVALADQPLIEKDTYNTLIEESLCCHKGIIVPAYQKRRGNPAVFSIEYKRELLGLEGDVGGREILKRHPDDTLEVAVDSPSVTMGIDTLDDYHSCLKLAQKEGREHHAQESQTGPSHRNGPRS